MLAPRWGCAYLSYLSCTFADLSGGGQQHPFSFAVKEGFIVGIVVSGTLDPFSLIGRLAPQERVALYFLLLVLGQDYFPNTLFRR
jgi:hypothetical protein